MHEKEIEEDEGKMEHLAATIVFPLSKITQQNNAEGVKMRKHKLKLLHKQGLYCAPCIPHGSARNVRNSTESTLIRMEFFTHIHQFHMDPCGISQFYTDYSEFGRPHLTGPRTDPRRQLGQPWRLGHVLKNFAQHEN